MKKVKFQIGPSAAIVGVLIQTLAWYSYEKLFVWIGYIITAVGVALMLSDIIKKGSRFGMMLVGGMLGFAIELVINLINTISEYEYVTFSVILIINVATLILFTLSMLRPENDIDATSLSNIKKNRNKGGVIFSCLIILFGLIVVLSSILEALMFMVLVGLVIIAFGVFRTVKLLSQPDIREDELYDVKDEALNSEIVKMQNMLRIIRIATKVGYIAAFVVAVVAFSSGSAVALIVVMVIICGILTMVQNNLESKIKTYVADNITKQALGDVFDITSYEPFGQIDGGKLRGRYFGISDFNRVSGSDYVRGFYKGLPIEFCDLELTERRTRTDENGNEEEYYLPVFHGFWLICDFGKELSAALRLWERDKLGKLVGGKGIVTDNEKFNKHFHIESDVEVEAFYILTPHMMEYILDMDKKAKGQTHMRFERDGKVHIAIDSGRDAFEVTKKDKDATLLRKQFVREIRYITDIIDELRLVDTLYKK